MPSRTYFPEYTYTISKNQVVRRKKQPKTDDSERGNDEDNDIPRLTIADILLGRGAKILRKEAARQKELARQKKVS